MKKRFTLGAKERLKSRKKISELFRNGKKIQNHPLTLHYSAGSFSGNSSFPYLLQMGAGVSSRHFKKAVDRNRIKRIMRESYRTQNQELKDFVKVKCLELQVFFIYSGRELPQLADISPKMALILQQLLKELEKND